MTFWSELHAAGAHPFARILTLLAIAAVIPLWLKVRARWPQIELPLFAIALIGPPLICAPLATLVTALTVVAALGFGRRACKWLRLDFKTRSSEIAIAAGIGFGAWILALMLLAMLGQLRPAFVVSILLLTGALCWRNLPRVFDGIRDGVFEPTALAGISTMFLGAMILVLQPVILTPSIQYDPLATHLAASRNFSLHHSMAPFGDYGFLPQGFELMMGGADTLAGQAAEQMVAPVFLTLLWIAIYAIAREFGSRKDAALGAATLAIALPFVQWTGAIAKNDVPMAFFLLISLLASLRAISTIQPKWIFVASFAAAAAANIKHTAFLGIAPLAILVFLAALRGPNRIRTIANSASLFLLCGSFWMIRAAYSKGDLLFPLRSPGAMETPAYRIPIAERLSYLAKVQFGGTPIFEGNSSTRLGPFFLLFLPAALFIRRRDFDGCVAAGCFFAGLYLLLWFATWPVLRYGIAPIMLFAVALATAFFRAGGRFQFALIALVLCHLFNLSKMAGMSLNLSRLEYLAGRMDRDAYLGLNLGSYPAIAWVRDHAPAGARILSIGTHSLAYAPDPALMDSPFPEDGPFPPEKVLGELTAKPYRYAIVPRTLDFAALFDRKTPAFADSRFAVFELP